MLNSSNQRIPLWVFIIIIVLGWNEFMYILSNPLYLIIALLLIGFFGWGWFQQNLKEYLRTGNPSTVFIIKQFLNNLPIKIIDLRDLEETEPSSSTLQSQTTPKVSSVFNTKKQRKNIATISGAENLAEIGKKMMSNIVSAETKDN